MSDKIERGPEQATLFENPPEWAEHWVDMPEFNQENREPLRATVLFETVDKLHEFYEKMGYPPDRSRPIWYPRKQVYFRGAWEGNRLPDCESRYPIYVISKGRADLIKSQSTSAQLTALGIDHALVIERPDLDSYRVAFPDTRILVLPFENLGQGSIPARNWVWNHAESSGNTRHWILDDNIGGWYTLNNNERRKIASGNPFGWMETFVERYSNIALAGPHNITFCSNLETTKPYILNSRIYSCILIDHRLRHRWRGRYNEDTDLSIRSLKDGLCTVLFTAFLMDKAPTLTVEGGNTDELYAGNGRLKMAESLVEQHPDIVKITWKWNRWQHQVDYSGFKQKLIPVDRTNREIERIRAEHNGKPAWQAAMAEADWKAEEYLEQEAE